MTIGAPFSSGTGMNVPRDRRAPAGGGQNAITFEEAEQQARVARRVGLLKNELPGLAYSNESLLLDLAAGLDDDADMMQAAIDSMTIADQDMMLAELKEMPEEQQRVVYDTMHPTKRGAVDALGWKPPKEKRGGFGGWIDSMKPTGLKDAAMTAINPLGAARDAIPRKANPTTYIAAGIAGATKLPGVSHVLGGMDYIAEETSRPMRVAPIQESGRRLLDETGMSEEQLFEQTGIKAHAGNSFGNNDGGILGALGYNVTAFAGIATDPWKAAQTWNAIGHEGSDDFLPEVQMEVYSKFEDEFGQDEAKDMLRWAKGIAAGHSMDELADMEGMEGDQVEAFKAQVASLAAAPQFKQQVARLTSGQVSPGRTVARVWWDDPTKDVSKGATRYVSGGMDAVWVIGSDPTLVAGKITKSIKGAKWAFKTGDRMDDLLRHQENVRALMMADEGVEGFDLADELARIAEKHGTKNRTSKLAQVMDRWSPVTAEAQARAVYEPAKAISEAVKTGDYATLVRKLPMMETQIADIKRYDATLKTMQREAGEAATGLTKPDAVFEFYKHAASNKSIINGVDDVARVQIKSQRMFGRDGGGHLVVPHMTNPQRKVMEARESFRNWRYNLAEGEATFGERAGALTDLKASADEAHQSLVDEGLAEPFDPDDWIVDSETFTYQRKPPEGIKKVINQLIEITTTPTTRAGYVPVTDDVATSAQQFRAFSETMGIMAGDSIVTRMERYNRFVNGTIQDRHALIQSMTMDMASLTGINATDEGAAMIRKHVEHNNQVYGHLDEVAKANGEDASRLIVKQGIFESQIAQALSVPSAKDMLVASRNANMLRWVTGTTRKSWLEAGMTRVWKPAQLMRLGFPLRAGADEALQFIGRVSLSDYVDKAVLQKWAGIRDLEGQLVRHNITGEVLMAPQGAIKPIRSFTRSWATIFGVTDKELDEAARAIAARNPEWIRGTTAERAAAFAKARAEARGNLKALPKSVRWLDEMAHDTAMKSSEWFHKTAASKYVSRQDFAEGLLKLRGDLAKRIESNRYMYLHPVSQQGATEVAGATFTGLRPGVDDPLSGAGMLAFDKDSPTKFKYVPVTRRSEEWEWVGHDDPTSFYLNFDHWMRSMNDNSPSFRAQADELLHHVPQSVIDELAVFGGDGIDAVKEARRLVADADPELSNILMYAAENDATADTLREVLEARGLMDSEVDLEALLLGWDDLSPKAKDILTDTRLLTSKLTADWNTVVDRAANAGHNAMRRLDQASDQRGLVRGQTVDGRPVAEPLREGHTRVYGVMVDRRHAEDLLRIFSDESMAQSFAERLGEHLGQQNLKRHMKTAWDAAVPGAEGYDLATWMAGVKAQIIAGKGSYIPAMMTGTSNPAVAQAMRDALADVLPEQVLRPTIGYLDHPDDLLTSAFGMEKLDDAVVAMSPNQAAIMKHINPDDQVRMVKVRRKDGTVMWAGEEELETLAGKTAWIDGTEVSTSFGMKSHVRFDPGTKSVSFNPKLIGQDFKDGMKFLRGEGGTMSRKGATWGWDDAEAAEMGSTLADWLDAHGLGNSGMDLDQMIGLYRSPQRHKGRLPFEDVMRDNEVWDDFVELASTAKKSGTRDVETWFRQDVADQSKIVKGALDRMGIDVDELDLTAKEYQSLLIAREQAHAALAPAGFRRPMSDSPEAIEREMDALAIAFQKSGIDVPSNLRYDELATERDELISSVLDDAPEADIAFRDRRVAEIEAEMEDLRAVLPENRVAVARKSSEADYEVLGEVWGNGVTEDVAMRRTAQDQLNETLGMFVSRQSGEVMREILSPLRRGSHSQDNLWTKVSMNDLPVKSFGPMRVAAADTRWDRMVRRTFDGAWDPTISAISRTPMYSDAFHKSMETYRAVRENTIHKGLDAKARQLLAGKGFEAEDLRDVLDFVGSQLKAAPDLGAGLDDPFVEYLKALQKGESVTAADNLARIHLRDRLPEDPDAAKALIEKTREQFIMDDDELKLLKNWHANQTSAVDEWVHRSTQHAIEMVAPYVDDHRIRLALNEYLGPVAVPYLYAEEQFLRRVARGLYETPHMLRKGQLTMNGLRNIGVIREDAYGNELFVIPGSELLMGRVADVAELLTGNPAWQVLDQPLAMRTDFVLPGWNNAQSRWGWGPIVGLSVDQLTTRYPEYEFRTDDPGRPWWSHIVPGPASGAYRAFMQQGDPTQVASAQIAAISYLEANGHGLPDNATASQKEDYQENVRQVARSIGIIRYVTGQVGFSAAAPIDTESLMRKEFTDLLATGLDYGEAMDRWIEQYGPEAMVYTVFGTTNETGAPLFNTTTDDALQFMFDNEDLVRDRPEAMAWLLPQGDSKSSFDRRAYNEQLALGLRTRKSPQEMVDAVRVKQAAEEYWEAKGNYEVDRNLLVEERDALKGDAKKAAQERINRLDDQWSTWKGGYMKQHPTFEESLTQDASDRRKKVLEELRWLMETDVGGEQAEAIRPMIENYWAFTTEYSAWAGQTSKVAKEHKENMLKDYFDEQWLYVKQNPKAAPFWNSVIRPELPDAADPLVRESEALGGA